MVAAGWRVARAKGFDRAKVDSPGVFGAAPTLLSTGCGARVNRFPFASASRRLIVGNTAFARCWSPS